MVKFEWSTVNVFFMRLRVNFCMCIVSRSPSMILALLCQKKGPPHTQLPRHEAGCDGRPACLVGTVPRRPGCGPPGRRRTCSCLGRVRIFPADFRIHANGRALFAASLLTSQKLVAVRPEATTIGVP